MQQDEEIKYLRSSIHDLRTQVQTLTTNEKLRDLQLAQFKVDLDRCVAQSATSTQLQNAVEVLTLKLDTFGENLKALNRIIAWVGALVGAAVIGAGLNVILK